MQFINSTVNDFRHFIEPNSSSNLITEYDLEGKGDVLFVDFALSRLNPLRSEFEDSLTEVLLLIGKSEKEILLNKYTFQISLS